MAQMLKREREGGHELYERGEEMLKNKTENKNEMKMKKNKRKRLSRSKGKVSRSKE